LTESLYTAIATTLSGRSSLPGDLFIAVGRGHPSWDGAEPDLHRHIEELVDEVARLPVKDGVEFLNSRDQPAPIPTPRIRLRVEFPRGEDLGTLRECGLFAGDATEAAGSGLLLAYYVHPRLDKPADSSLARSLILDFLPQQIAPGTRVARFLANVRSEELHDLDNRTSECQIEQIRFDRRCYLGGIDQAREMGYDFCAYCFGADMSER
jgi:hypothetical protein